MKPSHFGQCSCCINIDKSNYPEETELDTNPSPTLARTLTLSTGERRFWQFHVQSCYDTTIFNFTYMNSPNNLGSDPESRSEIDFRRKITTAWNWRLKNKYNGNTWSETYFRQDLFPSSWLPTKNRGVVTTTGREMVKSTLTSGYV